MIHETETAPKKPPKSDREAKPQTEIGLGDLAQVVAALKPVDPAVRSEILVLLGLRARDVLPELKTDRVPTPDEKKEAEQTRPEDPAAAEKKSAARRTHRRSKPALTARPVRFTLQRRDDQQPESVPAWFATYDQDQRETAPDLPPLPLQELIPPDYVRTVLARLLATPVPEGVVDVDGLVDLIARGQPVSQIPRNAIPSLRQGVQVLVDIDDTLAPFSEDQEYLLTHIEDLVGVDNLNLLWFEGNPLLGVFGENDDSPRLYEPPPHGSKVILLTDLGIGNWMPQRALIASGLWRRFARIIHEADAHLVALVPYGSWRWPPALRGVLPMLYWERFWNARRPRRRDSLPVSMALRALARRNPQALKLAKFLSLAARIDHSLLRAARLKLIPKADAGAEADLWLSPIVQSRSVASLLLMPKVARELRQLLVLDGKEAVEEAWQFLSNYRQRGGITYDTRQEEYMNYLALHPDRDEVDEATRLLQEALAALVKGGEKRLDVARWALRAIPRLPETVRNLSIAGELYYAAAVRLGITPADESVLPEDLNRLDWLKPPDAGTTSVGVQLIEGGLIFSRQVRPEMSTLTVKDATPTLFDVSWPAVVDMDRQQVSLGPAGQVTLGASTCQLISVSDDGTIRHWQVNNGQEIALFKEPDHDFQCIAVSPDGRTLAGGDRQGNITLWDLHSGRQLLRQEVHVSGGSPDNLDREQNFTQKANFSSGSFGLEVNLGEGVAALSFSSDSRYLAVAVAGSNVQIWQVFKTRLLQFRTLGSSASSLSFAPHNNNVLTGHSDGTIALWDLEIGEIRPPAIDDRRLFEDLRGGDTMGLPPQQHFGPIKAVTFSPDGGLAVTGDDEGLILLWDVAQGSIVDSIGDFKPAVNDLAFNNDGTRLAAAGSESLVVFAVENGAITRMHERGTSCYSIAFSPDGAYLFSGHEIGEIQVLETSTSQKIAELPGHNLIVTDLITFNPPATTFTIHSGEGRQVTIGPDRRALTFTPIMSFDHLIDGSRRSLHPEVDNAVAKIDEWLSFPRNIPPSPGRAFVATGGLASGKSTLAGTLVEMSRGQSGTLGYSNLRKNMLAAVHICSDDQEKSFDARHFVISFAVQIAEFLPEFGERLYAIGRRKGIIPMSTAELTGTGPLTMVFETSIWQNEPAAALLQTYLVEPLTALAEEAYFDELLILVSDLHKAVDRSPATGEPLLPLLPALDGLPYNVRFIFVTRAHPQVMARLAALEPERFALSPESEGEVHFDRTAYRVRLQEVLLDFFDLEEIRTLCFVLDINYEDLAGSDIRTKILALVEHMDRLNRLADLHVEVARQKPEAASKLPALPPDVWSSLGKDSSAVYAAADLAEYVETMGALMETYFTESELRDISFDLQIDFESLPGDAKYDFARGLVEAAARLGLLRELERLVTMQRPAVGWPDISRAGTGPTAAKGVVDRSDYLGALTRLLNESFNEEEIKTLCFILAVDYDILPGQGRKEKITELIAFMDRNGRLVDLETEARQQRPRAPWPEGLSSPEADSTPLSTELADHRKYHSEIYRLINDHFNEEELRIFCFDLGVEYENLPAQGRSAKVRELVLYLERRGRLTELEDLLRRKRPSVAWPDFPPATGSATTERSNRTDDLPEYRSMLRLLLDKHFSQQEIKTLCFDLGVVYEDLPGARKLDKIRELMAHMERAGRLEDLVAEARRQRPEAPWPETPSTSTAGRQVPRPGVEQFVNRQREQRLFEDMLKLRTEQRILLVQGASGMGKTMLLSVMARRLEEYPDILSASFNLQTYRTTGAEYILRSLSQRLGGEHNFPNFSRALGLANEFTDVEASIRNDQLLSGAFIEDLMNLVKKEKVAVLVIFFDSFEQVPIRTRHWIESEMLTWVERLDNILFIIAGQELPLTDEPWAKRATTIELGNLSLEDVREYFVRREINVEESTTIEDIYKAFQGKPDQLADIASILQQQ